MNTQQLINAVKDIIDIPEPKLLWDDVYGYKTSLLFKNGKNKCYCFGGRSFKKKKADMVRDIIRVLLWDDDIKYNSIIYPKIKITKGQFNEIRELGRKNI